MQQNNFKYAIQRTDNLDVVCVKTKAEIKNVISAYSIINVPYVIWYLDEQAGIYIQRDDH